MAITVAMMLIAGLITTLGLGVLVWRKRSKLGGSEVNYKAFFIMGICFLPVGIALSSSTENPGLIGISALGAAYLAIGLKNRDKWEK